MHQKVKKPNVNTLYQDCIVVHALNWLKSYQQLSAIEYLEFHGGPVLAYFISERGLAKVVQDIQKEINLELSGNA